MPTSDAVSSAPRVPLIDGRFLKRFVMVCGAVPGVLLAWDALRGQLGVNEVNFAIRTTGKLGLVFLALSLLITPLRRLTGWNQLIAVRRQLGLFAFLYVAAHFAIFVLYDRDGSLAGALEEIVARVYLWFGTAALVFMMPLAATSTDAMISRLGARRWKLLHRLAYPAAIGGIVHFYLLVKADVTQPAAFAVVVGGLLAYRVGRHYLDLRAEIAAARARMMRPRVTEAGPEKRAFWSGQLVVSRIFRETPDVKTFRLAVPGGGKLPFEHVAGQYLNIALTIDGKRVNRSYTIASSPTRTASCEITVKRVADGRASFHLHDSLREGSIVHVSAPAGRFVFAGNEASRVVLIAGGVGITPMMSVVRNLTDRSWTGDIYLLFSVRRRDEIIFADELAYLQARFPNLHVCITLSDDAETAWDGPRGRVTRELIEGLVPGLTRGPVLLCGPTPMMIAMREMLVAMGVPDAEILQEAFVSPSPSSAAANEDTGVAMSTVEPVTGGGASTVHFQRAGKTAELATHLTLLEAAEEAGVRIPFECRSGICGQCKTKLVSGQVTMDCPDALTPGDRARGLILACQARAVRDIVVDA